MIFICSRYAKDGVSLYKDEIGLYKGEVTLYKDEVATRQMWLPKDEIYELTMVNLTKSD